MLIDEGFFVCNLRIHTTIQRALFRIKMHHKGRPDIGPHPHAQLLHLGSDYNGQVSGKQVGSEVSAAITLVFISSRYSFHQVVVGNTSTITLVIVGQMCCCIARNAAWAKPVLSQTWVLHIATAELTSKIGGSWHGKPCID